MKKQKQENAKATNPFPAMEEQVLAFWDKAKIFEKSVERPGGETDKIPQAPFDKGGNRSYVFYDGPPFGTGEPHYGHILSSIAKDMVPRYWTMQGFRVERKWGWDCHGLPIENIIEKDLGISGKKEIEKLGIAKFNEACRARVLEYADVWGKMIHRIGRWVDFKNSYKTMDLTYMESVWWGFSQLWKKDLVYQGRKVLLYCPRCETPISNFEVAMDNSYKEITETSVYAKFKLITPLTPLVRGAKEGLDDNVFILAWTTTPWTLPGNIALAVGEKIKYVIVKPKTPLTPLDKGGNPPNPLYQGGEYFILAKERLEILNSEYEIVKEVKGKDLVGLTYEPLFDIPVFKNSGKEVFKVFAGDFVTTEDGTGVVHTAAVYGEEDYEFGVRHDLPIIPALDEKGIFNDTVPQFKGLYFLDANKKIIEDLKNRKPDSLIFATQNTPHSYPHCWRCDTQLYYNAIPAWFLSIEKLRKRMLDLNERINWFPEHLKRGRFALGIEQAPDWNISRNRYFATPMPIWQCDKCEEREIIGSVEELEKKSGKKNIKDIHMHFIDDLTWPCQECDGVMHRIKEVFDCWVESGSMSFAQMHYPFEHKEKFENNFPAQFISEYISQTRAWFYVMHVMSTALFDSQSFENVIASGVILNEKGEKLSKSKKNFPDPWKVINEFGVDALRFYLMSSSLMQAENLFFNERELRDVFRKNIMILWNVYKFYEMYADDGKKQTPLAPLVRGEGNVLDVWIGARLKQLIKEVTDNMNGYDIPRAIRPISEFINDLSTWYIRRSRDRFKSENETDKQAALATTKFILEELSLLIAPVMPFLAEQIWQKVTGSNFKDENNSVHLNQWPAADDLTKDEADVLKNMAEVRKIVELGLAARDQAGIKVRQTLSEFSIFNFQFSMNDQYLNLIKQELNVKVVNVKTGKGELSVKLDTTMSDELKLEGLKREIVRTINAKRKQAGLTIKDKITLKWQSDSQAVKNVFAEYANEIKKETIAEKIVEGEAENEVVVNGEKVSLSVEKSN